MTPEQKEKIKREVKDWFIKKNLQWSDNWADCIDLIIEKVSEEKDREIKLNEQGCLICTKKLTNKKHKVLNDFVTICFDCYPKKVNEELHRRGAPISHKHVPFGAERQRETMKHAKATIEFEYDDKLIDVDLKKYLENELPEWWLKVRKIRIEKR